MSSNELSNCSTIMLVDNGYMHTEYILYNKTRPFEANAYTNTNYDTPTCEKISSSLWQRIVSS